MKANELRIGNSVRKKGIWFRVDEILKDGSMFCYPSNGDVTFKVDITEPEPIPLTPEILEKAGFELHPVVKHWWKSSNNFMVIINSEKDKPFVYWVNSMQVKELKYLHEVQNLHFVLTGKELTINF